MNRRNRSPAEDKLAARLLNAQVALRQVLPHKVVALLTSDGDCLTRADVHQWRDRVVEAVLTMAETRPDPEPRDCDRRQRACCPLCGGTAPSPAAGGFQFPDGLALHLRGERSGHDCPVLRVIYEQALESVEDEFSLALRRRFRDERARK